MIYFQLSFAGIPIREKIEKSARVGLRAPPDRHAPRKDPLSGPRSKSVMVSPDNRTPSKGCVRVCPAGDHHLRDGQTGHCPGHVRCCPGIELTQVIVAILKLVLNGPDMILQPDKTLTIGNPTLPDQR